MLPCVAAPVTNSPPRIIQRPPNTKTTVMRGQNLTLECVVEGAPVPVVTWDKYGGHLPEGRYSQLLGEWTQRAGCESWWVDWGHFYGGVTVMIMMKANISWVYSLL